MEMEKSRDLILGPFEYAFVRDDTKGRVNVYVGPHKTSLAGTDKTVLLNNKVGRFQVCAPDTAITPFVNVPKGSYVVLSNPSKDSKQPEAGKICDAQSLLHGQKVNIPGPWFNPLWPGQTAHVLEGHLLRSNQYLICRVYDEEIASKNWNEAVIKEQKLESKPDSQEDTDLGEDVEESPTQAVIQDEESKKVVQSDFDMTTGQLFIVSGTEVSFYIPPTGVEVLHDSKGEYIRNAVTLEQLEYCVLLDENGNKRYQRGPAVVFPKPTERFLTRTLKDDVVTRRFRAIELNEISGLYIKVIAPYTEDKKSYKEGEELFITGKDQMIYFPRAEHSIIRYGDHDVHYAVAVPAGEGRYVMDRITGDVKLIKGPRMLLPDPRKEVIVRRVLDINSVKLLYPGNVEALAYNKYLDELSNKNDTYLTDNRLADAVRSSDPKGLKRPGTYTSNVIDNDCLMYATASCSSGDAFEEEGMLYSRTVNLDSDILQSSKTFDKTDNMPTEDVYSNEMVVDRLERKTNYTKPRTVILDTTYEGAVKVVPWTGYAIQTVNGNGVRKVIVGPTVHILEYDENVEKFFLSKGVPKNKKNKIEDIYLRVLNNRITDEIEAETKDMVSVEVTVIYKVDFTGDPNKWFNIENYVQYLCDSCRSIIRKAIKSVDIQEFHDNYIDLVRDNILGKSGKDGRSGRLFEENGMRIKDVEIIEKEVLDEDISELIDNAQVKVAELSINVALKDKEVDLIKAQHVAEKKLAEMESDAVAVKEVSKRAQLVERVTTEEQDYLFRKRLETVRAEVELVKAEGQSLIEMQEVTSIVERENFKQTAKLQQQEALGKIADAERKRIKEDGLWELEFAKGELENYIKKIEVDYDSKVAMAQSIQPGLIEALQSIAYHGMMDKLASHLAPLSIVRGQSIGNVITDMFEGTGFEDHVISLVDKVNNNGNGKNKTPKESRGQARKSTKTEKLIDSDM